MTNKETKEILEACQVNLMKIQDDSNHLTVGQAWDLFTAIESLESLLKDFQTPHSADMATADLIIAASYQQ